MTKETVHHPTTVVNTPTGKLHRTGPKPSTEPPRRQGHEGEAHIAADIFD
jgi:hypothetical protein